MLRIARPVCVVIGSATFAAAQVDWLPVTGGSLPAARDQAAMAPDHINRGMLLFGGGGNGGALDDTWLFTGGGWQPSTPAVRPPGRYGPQLAADPVRGRVVLFGGYDQQVNAMGDTWEWNGVSWTQLQPATSPAPRGSHAMTYDPVAGKVLLYGGADLLGPIPRQFTDTWEWDGVQWTQRTPATPPGDSFPYGMVFDDSRGVAVMVARLGTFEWNGSNWARVGDWPGGHLGRVAYDASRQRVVWYGGGDNNGWPLPIGVWDWLPPNWVQRTTSLTPPQRVWHAFAYDPFGERVVCFGGRDDSQPVASIRLGDTWTLGAVHPATVLPFGAGCNGSGGVPQIDALGRAWIGDPFAVRWSNLPPAGAAVAVAIGWSSLQWGTVALPLSLQPLGMPGCSLLVSTDGVAAATAASGSLTQSLATSLPASLLGLDLHVQGFALDAAANPAGATASNGLHLHVGTR